MCATCSKTISLMSIWTRRKLDYWGQHPLPRYSTLCYHAFTFPCVQSTIDYIVSTYWCFISSLCYQSPTIQFSMSVVHFSLSHIHFLTWAFQIQWPQVATLSSVTTNCSLSKLNGPVAVVLPPQLYANFHKSPVCRRLVIGQLRVRYEEKGAKL